MLAFLACSCTLDVPPAGRKDVDGSFRQVPVGVSKFVSLLSSQRIGAFEDLSYVRAILTQDGYH